MAIAPSAKPARTSGLTPVCWITRVCTVVEVTTRMPVSGRNASPVVSGESPSCCCRTAVRAIIGALEGAVIQLAGEAPHDELLAARAVAGVVGLQDPGRCP